MQYKSDEAMAYFKEILDMVSDFTWIAGGAVRDFFMYGSVKKDIDLWSLSRSSVAMTVLSIRKNGGKYLASNNRCIFMLWNNKKIDVVKNTFKDEESTISEFDFTVCCAAVSKRGVFVHNKFFEHLSGRKLILNSIKFPVATLSRAFKYAGYGFSICDRGILDIAKSISLVDLNLPENNPIEFYPGGKIRFVRFD